jgi:periplasmic divalent cation tolerance protein
MVLSFFQGRTVEIASIYMTASSREEALSIARILLAERLIACANVLPEITSVYNWEGALHEAPEFPVLLKTRTSLIDAVTIRIRQLHSYQVPSIVAWKSIGGNADYFDWVHAATAPSQSQ